MGHHTVLTDEVLISYWWLVVIVVAEEGMVPLPGIKTS